MNKYLLIFLAILFSWPLQAKEKIVWAVAHIPPWMILEGEYAGQGAWDAIQQQLISNMPEYEHQIRQMPHRRYLLEARKKHTICKVFLFQTDHRKQYLVFSDPVAPILANALVLKQKNRYQPPIRKLLTSQNKTVSLHHILQQGDIVVASKKGRSYGSGIDHALAMRYPGHLPLSFSNKQILSFFHLNRVDAVLEFPAAVAYHQKIMKNPEQLALLRLRESESFNLGYASCAKNSQGKAIIKKINRIMEDYIKTVEYKEKILQWHHDEKDRALLLKLYQSIFLY